MKTVAQLTAAVSIVILAIVFVGFAIYGQYQASQLYPAINQQLGFQACVTQVQAEQAKQQQQQQPKPIEDGSKK